MKTENLQLNQDVQRYYFEATNEALIELRTNSITIYDIWNDTEMAMKDSLALPMLKQLMAENLKVKACIVPHTWAEHLEVNVNKQAERLKMKATLPVQITHIESEGSFHFSSLTDDTDLLSQLLYDSDPSCPGFSAAKKQILEIQSYYFGAILESSACLYDRDKLIGACIYTQLFDTPLLCHYFIAPDYQQRGLAKALLSHCSMRTGELGFNSLIASVDVHNTASIKTLSSAGYQKIGSEKYAVLICGDS